MHSSTPHIPDEPAILGVYRTAGEEGPAELVLALRLPGAKVLTLPLGRDGLPSGQRVTLPAQGFADAFRYDADAYAVLIYPALVSLKRRFGPTSGFVSVASLPLEEGRLFAVLQVDELAEQDTNSARRKVAKRFLETVPDEDLLSGCHPEVIAERSVSLRKEQRFDAAVAAGLQAIEKSPADDHLWFNLARALYEKGDRKRCRQALEQALRLNPELEAARKFLRFLDKEKDSYTFKL